MKKRLTALFCFVLALLWCACAAADSVISFTMPQGAEHREASQAGGFAVPEGLEPMYRLMRSGDASGSFNLFRMKNGRALLSVSLSALKEPIATQELLGNWKRFAGNIAKDVQFVDDSDQCARLGERFGLPTLEIDTTAVVGDNASLKLTLHCSAFCREGELAEVWVVYPAQTTYLFDDAAYAELSSDIADVEALLATIDFGTGDATGASIQKPDAEFELTEYADPRGRFVTQIPKDCLIITSDSGTAALDALRAELVAKYGEGANAFCDNNFKDIAAEDATLIALPDRSAIAMLYRVKIAGFENATVDDLLRTYKATEESLTQKFGSATCLLSNGKYDISDKEHAWMSYLLRADQTDMILNLFCYVDEGGYLRETDVFWMIDENDDPPNDALLYSIVNNTSYLTPAGE